MNSLLHSSRRLASRSLLLAGLAPLSAASNTWIVGLDSNGLPGHAFDICQLLATQPVVNGDEILIHPGTYPPFDLGSLSDITVRKFTLPTVLPDPAPAVIQPQFSIFCPSLTQGIRITSPGIVIEGLTISGFDNSNFNDATGAGIYIEDAAPTIRMCHITGNKSDLGGGIYVNNFVFGDPLVDPTFPETVVEDCLIELNEATNTGGGIYVQGGPILVDGTTITANEAGFSGAGACVTNFDNNEPCTTPSQNCVDLLETSRFVDCDISNNGLISNPIWGGGLYFLSGINVILENCSVDGNLASEGGGLRLREGVRLDMDRCRVRGNTANIGGGLNSRDSWQGQFSNTLFEENIALEHGGGVAITHDLYSPNLYSSELFHNCLFVGNRADGPTPAAPGGGGLYIKNAGPIFQHCTFSENVADPTFLSDARGGGFLVDNFELYFYLTGGAPPTQTPTVPVRVSVANCLFAGNTAGSDMNLWQFSQETSPCPPNDCDTVEEINSLFLTSAGSAFFVSGPASATYPNGDFYLDQALSPAIDAGHTSFTEVLTGTTEVSGALDAGAPDIGFHYDVLPRKGRTSVFTASASSIELPDGPDFGLANDVTWTMNAGANKGPNVGTRLFIFLATLSGSQPGTPLSVFGGPANEYAPIAWDSWTNQVLGNLGIYSPVFVFDLDNDGFESVTLNLGNVFGADLGVPYVKMQHAFWVVEDFVSGIPSQPSQYHEVWLLP